MRPPACRSAEDFVPQPKTTSILSPDVTMGPKSDVQELQDGMQTSTLVSTNNMVSSFSPTTSSSSAPSWLYQHHAGSSSSSQHHAGSSSSSQHRQQDGWQDQDGRHPIYHSATQSSFHQSFTGSSAQPRPQERQQEGWQDQDGRHLFPDYATQHEAGSSTATATEDGTGATSKCAGMSAIHAWAQTRAFPLHVTAEQCSSHSAT